MVERTETRNIVGYNKLFPLTVKYIIGTEKALLPDEASEYSHK